MVIQGFFNAGFIANEQKLKTFMPVTGQSCARDHNAHAFITAHRVNR